MGKIINCDGDELEQCKYKVSTAVCKKTFVYKYCLLGINVISDIPVLSYQNQLLLSIIIRPTKQPDELPNQVYGLQGENVLLWLI